MALSDTYHDTAWDFKDEADTYLDLEFYTKDQIRRAKSIFKLLKNEGSLIDTNNSPDVIKKQNKLLDSLKII